MWCWDWFLSCHARSWARAAAPTLLVVACHRPSRVLDSLAGSFLVKNVAAGCTGKLL